MEFSRFRFRNISILKKTLLTLLVTFLLPLILAGIVTAFYIGGRDAEYESRQELAVLSSLSRELTGTLKTVEGIADLVAAKGLAWNFAGGRENYRDYINITELSDNVIRNVPLVKSIVLFRNNRVIFERGPALDSGLPAYPEDLALALRVGGSACWTGPRVMNFFFTAVDPLMLSLYRALGDVNSSLVLFTGLSVRELAEQYHSYIRGKFFLLDADAKVLAAADDGKSPSASDTEAYPADLFRRFKGDSGFFRSPDRTLILYVKGFRGWYLVNQISPDLYRSSRGEFYWIIIIAAALGVCFAAASLIVQRRYIFNPLKTMLREMNHFEAGNLDAKMSYESGDEIGWINREVEKIFNRLHDLIHEVYISKIYNQEATFKILSSQINPHFLYNTLDSIRWKAIENHDLEVGEQIEALSDLFRHILNRGADQVTVEQEIKHLRTYLYIMGFRYQDRMKCTITVEEGLEKVIIPKLILQPLVENAIVHGIDKLAGAGEIQVFLERRNEYLCVSVSDNGMGTDAAAVRQSLREETLPQAPPIHGFALRNIDRRIKLFYGEAYGLEFDSHPGKGTVVTIIIPLEAERT